MYIIGNAWDRRKTHQNEGTLLHKKFAVQNVTKTSWYREFIGKYRQTNRSRLGLAKSCTCKLCSPPLSISLFHRFIHKEWLKLYCVQARSADSSRRATLSTQLSCFYDFAPIARTSLAKMHPAKELLLETAVSTFSIRKVLLWLWLEEDLPQDNARSLQERCEDKLLTHHTN